MRYHHGKWVASYRDTFSLDTTLSPIIYAGLSKFHDVLEQKNREGKCLGIPNEYMKNEADWGSNVNVTDSDVQDWLDDIKKMMYAFENKEPDIRNYNFSLEMVPINWQRGSGESVSYTIECDNLEEKARYYADCEGHERLVQEGLKLTFEKWGSLWW